MIFDESVGTPEEVGVAEEFVLHPTEATNEPDQFEQYRNQALGELNRRGYVERDSEGRVICDIDRFREIAPEDRDVLFTRMGPLGLNSNFGNRKWIPTLYHTLHDLQVYSKEDYQKLQSGEQVDPKPLFYVPKNNEAATSIDEIRNAKFHMGLWEVGNRPVLPVYPTEDKGFDSRLSPKETTLACAIYNPAYGDGERREDGKLYVRLHPRAFEPEFGDYYLQGDPNEKRPLDEFSVGLKEQLASLLK